MHENTVNTCPLEFVSLMHLGDYPGNGSDESDITEIRNSNQRR